CLERHRGGGLPSWTPSLARHFYYSRIILKVKRKKPSSPNFSKEERTADASLPAPGAGGYGGAATELLVPTLFPILPVIEQARGFWIDRGHFVQLPLKLFVNRVGLHEADHLPQVDEEFRDAEVKAEPRVEFVALASSLAPALLQLLQQPRSQPAVDEVIGE